MSEDLHRRVARLERENHRLRLGLAIGLAMIVAAQISGCDHAKAARSSEPADVIRARKFELLDGNDKPRGILLIDGRSVAVQFLDESGRKRTALGVAEGKPGLILYDSGGTTRAGVALTADGVGAVGFYDAAGNTRVMLAETPEGSSLWMNDSKGRTRSLLKTSDDKVAFGLMDAAGKPGARLGTNAEGKASRVP